MTMKPFNLRDAALVCLLALVGMLAGCQSISPTVDECAAYPTSQERTYCYTSKEVAALARATAQSYRDGVITREEAEKVQSAIRTADGLLDAAGALISQGDNAHAELIIVRELILGIN